MMSLADFQDPPFEGLHENCSPDLTEFAYSAAVMTFGGYPIISWEAAEKELLRVVRTRTPFETISYASIWYLEQYLAKRCIRDGLDSEEKVRNRANEEQRRD